MSSAILYVAIVAIWAGVLIPRWLRRDSASGEQVSDETMVTDAPAEEERPDPPRQQEDPPRQREKLPRQREKLPRQREKLPRQREKLPRQREKLPRQREDDPPRERPRARPVAVEARPVAVEARPVAVEARPVAVEARPVAVEARPVAVEARPVAVEARPKGGPARAEDDWAEDDRGGAPRDREHARVLSARKRLLGLVVVLTIGSGTLAGMRLAAWWVIVPPSVMLLGYLALLRAAAKADAERRQWARTRAATVTRVPAPVAPAASPLPARDAKIIEISTPQGPALQRSTGQRSTAQRSTGQADEEFYDQYADAKLRAVGD